MLIYNGQIIAGGGTIVLPMTRAEYEANKAILDSADVWVDLTDEPDQVATAEQIAYWVGQTQKSVDYIGSIATKAIAKVEPTDTALYLHEVGTYFINKDGDMCVTDSQISVNGTIVLGANCHVLSDGIASDINSKLDHTGTHECFGFGAGFSWGQCIAIFTPFDITDYTVSVSDVWVGSSSSTNISIPSADITNVTKHATNCITINISTSGLNLTDYPRLCSAKITLS